MKVSLTCRKKKLLSLLIPLMFALSILSVDMAEVSALEYPALMVVPENIVGSNWTLGTEFTVAIYTNYTFYDIWGYEFGLTYDPKVLHGGKNNTDFWTGDGVTTIFNATQTPVVQNSERIYVNQTLMTKPKNYTINYGKGEIKFTFTATDTWTGDNVTTVFYTTIKPIAEDLEKVYVDQTLMTRNHNYTIDYDTGEIEFIRGAPGSGLEVRVTYIYNAPGDGAEIQATYLYNGVANGDLIVGLDARFVLGQGFDNTEGALDLVGAYFYYLDPEWPTTTMGPGTLAYVTFTVVGKGNTSITIGPETVLKGWNPTDKHYDIISSKNTDTWAGDGTTTVYYANKTPVVQDSERVKVNQTLMTKPDDYTIAYDTGEITFTIAPGSEAEISARYLYFNYDHLQHGYFDNRYEHDVEVVNVTAPAGVAGGDLVSINVTVANIGKFDEVANVTIHYDSTLVGFNDTVALPVLPINYTDTWVGDNVTKSFVTIGKPILPDSEEVYVNQTLMTKPDDYTMDYEMGNITFETAPGLGAEIKAIYLQHGAIVSFSWNTTGLAQGAYNINATATIPDDGDPTDNWKTTIIIVSLHNVCVLSVTAPDKAPVGDLVSINVTVTNIGKFDEVANVTIHYDSTLVGFNDTVELPAQKSAIVRLEWNTTLVDEGIRTLNATVRLTDITDTWTALGINKTDAWTGDGVNTTFVTTDKPIVPDSEEVYVDDVPMTKPGNYTIDYEAGNITFTTAPGLGANVTATYSYLKKSFVTTDKPFVPDSEEVYVDDVPMTKPDDYTIDYNTGNITFETAPGLGAEIKAIYLPVEMDQTDNWKTTTILIVDHDVAVVNLTAPDTAAVGSLVPINVTVANFGAFDENVTLKVFHIYTGVPVPTPKYISIANITLARGENRPFSLSWNTTGLPSIHPYSINATATIPTIPVDDDPTDNLENTTITLRSYDVTVISIKPSPLTVLVGELIEIRVEVSNVGDENETFEVKVTYDGVLIGTQLVDSLPPDNRTSVYFSWNTTSVVPGLYMTWGEAVLDRDVNQKNNRKGYSVNIKSPFGTIIGNVTDAYTGLPIAGANVTAGDYSNTTNAYGYYIISGLQPGNYSVTASATGYESASQHNVTVVAAETTTANFTLRVISAITISADPTTITVGDSTTISGSITPTREGVTVTIQYRLEGEQTWNTLTTVTTNENSQYSHTWTPETAEIYEVKASWLGDDITSPAESNVQTIKVEEASAIPWYLYVAAAGVVAVIIAAAFYFLRIRKPT